MPNTQIDCICYGKHNIQIIIYVSDVSHLTKRQNVKLLSLNLKTQFICFILMSKNNNYTIKVLNAS